MKEPQSGGDKKQWFSLQEDSWGRLILKVLATSPGEHTVGHEKEETEDQQYVGVNLIRAFPLSAPAQGLSICTAEGREIVWIEQVNDLPAPLRQQVLDLLARREFVPILWRILRIRTEVDPCEWEVETDRGRTRFLVGSSEDVRVLPSISQPDDSSSAPPKKGGGRTPGSPRGHRLLIMDTHGIRYLILDVKKLDSTSQRLLEHYL